MKTAAATIFLAVLFVWAGPIIGGGVPDPFPASAHNANVTVIAKNQSWPVLNRGVSCDITRCIDI